MPQGGDIRVYFWQLQFLIDNWLWNLEKPVCACYKSARARLGRRLTECTFAGNCEENTQAERFQFELVPQKILLNSKTNLPETYRSRTSMSRPKCMTFSETHQNDKLVGVFSARNAFEKNSTFVFKPECWVDALWSQTKDVWSALAQHRFVSPAWVKL